MRDIKIHVHVNATVQYYVVQYVFTHCITTLHVYTSSLHIHFYYVHVYTCTCSCTCTLYMFVQEGMLELRGKLSSLEQMQSQHFNKEPTATIAISTTSPSKHLVCCVIVYMYSIQRNTTHMNTVFREYSVMHCLYTCRSVLFWIYSTLCSNYDIISTTHTRITMWTSYYNTLNTANQGHWDKYMYIN